MAVDERELVTDNSATLCVVRDRDGSQAGCVRVTAAEDNSTLEFQSLTGAKLFFGLWRRCGPFPIGVSDTVIPRSVAVTGEPTIAAYLAAVYDQIPEINTRETTAEALNVPEQTVSDYWEEIRWDGCLNCASEDTQTRIVRVGSDEVQILDCDSCGAYHVVPEDTRALSHTAEQSGCGNNCLTSAIGSSVSGEETYLFASCPACGYYTAEVLSTRPATSRCDSIEG